MSKFKAINAFIFAGSFSLGTIRAGFNLDRILEISDTQPQENAFYWINNMDIPVILPSEWENDSYLSSLNDVDLMCCNCPCSSLSQINRNASVNGKNNKHFYRLFNIFDKVQPKTFVIENAPTLIKLGLPILQDMIAHLSSNYKFTIIRDYAGNHNVAMKRLRTLVVGWNKKYFSKIPKIQEDKQKIFTVRDTLQNLTEDIEDYKSQTCDEIKDLYKYCEPGHSLMTALAKHVINDNQEILNRLNNTKYKKEVLRIVDKLNNKQNFWDKSPYRVEWDKLFPSFTSVTEYIHPEFNRLLNKKEMARIMNYPDTFSFEGECKIPVIQAMAQGVPANFGYYISNQIRLALENQLEYLEGDVIFQHHNKHVYYTYSNMEFLTLQDIEDKRKKELL